METPTRGMFNLIVPAYKRDNPVYYCSPTLLTQWYRRTATTSVTYVTFDDPLKREKEGWQTVIDKFTSRRLKGPAAWISTMSEIF